MKFNFRIRIYKDTVNSPVLSSISNLTISNITIISKPNKFGGICTHNGNQKKFGYNLKILGLFNKVSGSHSSPSLTFKGNYIEIEILNFPRFPAYCQEVSAARNCLNGYSYTNYLNKGFPHQLLYRKIEILFI